MPYKPTREEIKDFWYSESQLRRLVAESEHCDDCKWLLRIFSGRQIKSAMHDDQLESIVSGLDVDSRQITRRYWQCWVSNPACLAEDPYRCERSKVIFHNTNPCDCPCHRYASGEMSANELRQFETARAWVFQRAANNRKKLIEGAK